MSKNLIAMMGATPLDELAEWYENSVFAELLEYLSTRYFTVDFGNYENFSVSSGAGVMARNLILAFAFGFIAAILLTAYTRVHLGGFVRRLIKAECNSPESAKTLYELGFFRSVSIRSALKRGSALRMAVRYCTPEDREAACVKTSLAEGETAPEIPERQLCEKIDFMRDAFYVPESLRIRAELRFESKGSGWLPVLVAVVAIAVIAAVFCWFLPDVVQFADNLITVFAPK